MDNLLVLVFLALVGGLIWLHLNKGKRTEASPTRTQSRFFFHYVELIELALILCAGSMCAYFTYQVFSSVSETLATIAAVLVVAFNVGESILITNLVNSARHKNTLLVGLNVIGILCIAGYSLTAGSSILDTIIGKSGDIQKAYHYQLEASQQRIASAKAGILEAQTKARELDSYSYLNNSDIAKAQKNAALLSANELEKMAQLTKEKAPELKIAFGFDKEALAFLMAFSLELSIILVGIFKNLYVKTTPLLSAIRFKNKELDYHINPNHLNNLSLEHSPSPHVLGLPHTMQLSYAGTFPSVSPSVGSVPIHPVQTLPEPRARGTHGLEVTHGYTGLNDANLAPPEKQDELFDLWVIKLKRGELKPSTSDTRAFINEHRLATGIKLIAGLADSWLVRAENIGVLALNPIQKNGVSKYILANKKPTLSLTKGEGN